MDWMYVPMPPALPTAINRTDSFTPDRSVSAGCAAGSEAISKASLAIHKFVREVRESRSEFDPISAELHSLNGALDLLGYDAAFFSPSLTEHTPRVLDSCLALINELEGCISLLNRPDVSRAEKRSRWLASRHHVGTLWRTLSEYNIVFGLAADLIGV
jgi:GTPase-activating protein SAC7